MGDEIHDPGAGMLPADSLTDLFDLDVLERVNDLLVALPEIIRHYSLAEIADRIARPEKYRIEYPEYDHAGNTVVT